MFRQHCAQYTIIEARKASEEWCLMQAQDNISGQSMVANRTMAFLWPMGWMEGGFNKIFHNRITGLKAGGVEYGEVSNKFVCNTNLGIKWELEDKHSKRFCTKLNVISTTVHFTADWYFDQLCLSTPTCIHLLLKMNQLIVTKVTEKHTFTMINSRLSTSRSIALYTKLT